MDIFKIASKIANEIISGKEPDEWFKKVFFQLSEKAKELADVNNEKARKWLEEKLKNDLTSKGISIVSIEIKLGKFRGHPYITSAPVIVKVNEENANKLLNHLISVYSPKFKLKSFSDGIATFNVR